MPADDALCAVEVDVEDDDRGVLAGEPAHDGFADARAAAGDDRDESAEHRAFGLQRDVTCIVSSIVKVGQSALPGSDGLPMALKFWAPLGSTTKT